ncbi:DUF4145 domain-containing protein [Streptomyces sp900105245]|uniref:DUF4145 domain-containing protein n=1 Tax=Streptomyces sp. 900105245 TaxID=3154379 RepID=A0ABV1ULV3_9ACTN
MCPYTDCATGSVSDLVDLRMIAPETRECEDGSWGASVRAYDLVVWTEQEAWVCQLCSRTILEVIEYRNTEPDDGPRVREELSRLVLWPSPPPRALHAHVSERIRLAYLEASRAENAGAPRLAGVGYRSAVEELCKDQGATHRTLHGKIQELAAKGLPDEVITALEETRVVVTTACTRA